MSYSAKILPLCVCCIIQWNWLFSSRSTLLSFFVFTLSKHSLIDENLKRQQNLLVGMMMLLQTQVMDEESPRSIYAKKNNIGRKQNGFFTRKSKCIFLFGIFLCFCCNRFVGISRVHTQYDVGIYMINEISNYSLFFLIYALFSF